MPILFKQQYSLDKRTVINVLDGTITPKDINQDELSDKGPLVALLLLENNNHLKFNGRTGLRHSRITLR